MSEVIDAAVAALNEKLAGESFDGSAKFVIEGEGAVIVEDGAARAGDEDTDVTLTASRETFEELMAGALNPTSAFMTGKLSIDGDMGKAMKLGGILS